MIDLNEDETRFLTAIRDVLAERGDDFVYVPPGGRESNCMYSIDGGKTGSCLYGAVLIEKLHTQYARISEGSAVSFVIRNVGLSVRESLRELAFDLQEQQDRGNNYGAVRRNFERNLIRLGITLPAPQVGAGS